MLAASLAYQFGLEWGAARSRSFRFVVIDEAFGRGSDESARYGLELFEQAEPAAADRHAAAEDPRHRAATSPASASCTTRKGADPGCAT